MIVANDVESNSILAVGDSMTEFMGQILESFCMNSKVTNAGIGGTTAEQWASYTSEEISECGSDSDWNTVYIAVGGNDLLESGCTTTSTELADRMERAVKNIVTNLAPGASKYVMTGYCMPSQAEDEESGCKDPADFSALSDALVILSADTGNLGLPSNASLEVIDSLTVCGGSATSFSSQAYFQDPIHLNAKGYCEVFSQPSVQAALTCDAGAGSNGYNCDSLDNAEIPGLDNNCASGDGNGSGDNSGGLKMRTSAFTTFVYFCVSLIISRTIH